MNCNICSNIKCYNIECRAKLEIEPDHSGVIDMLRSPEELRFLIKCTAAATKHIDRFKPIPQLDFKIDEISSYLQSINLDYIISKKYDNDKALIKNIGYEPYMLLRFIITSCPVTLHHTLLVHGTHKFDHYKVDHAPSIETKFRKNNEKNGSLKYLYHGSPIHNWHSIIRNGIKVMSGTKDMTSGAAYGDGIYVTDLLTRSCAFTSGGSNIVIGVYEIYGSEKYRKHQDIHVIPSNQELLLRFLIWLPAIKDLNTLGIALNEKMTTKALNKTVASGSKHKKLIARINKEMELLRVVDEKANYNDDENKIIITIGGKQIVIDIPDNFPISAPSIDGSVIGDWTVSDNITKYLSSSILT